ncbi:proline-rich receptor-like protein kinase PERK2 [Glycine soja]|uniref:proline-rich receptor-like protein kinase PERK2 n=1 Tax=Glycine soja TaxID=3848 RepID=UPI00103D79AE|nr:proline-rich receptor-like protein kinase PERK2 [Glycine soja]
MAAISPSTTTTHVTHHTKLPWLPSMAAIPPSTTTTHATHHMKLPWLPLTIRSSHGCLSPPTLLVVQSLHDCPQQLRDHPPLPPQQPPHHLEFSSATEDRLEAVLAKLTLSQHNLAAFIDTLATTIDNLLQRLPRNPTPHFSSSIPAQASIPAAIISTPLMPTPSQTLPSPPPPPLSLPSLLKPTPSPTLTTFTTVPPPPAMMPSPPLLPLVPIQSRPTT